MRKFTKLAVLTAALAAFCSLTALASGWVQSGDDWYYTDSNGDYVYTTWKQSGNNYYYLGDEGKMLKDQLISDGSYYYYVGPDGARLVNQWQQVPADDTDTSTYGVDYRWYYFAANGKAYTSATKTINSKKYRFGEDGKMLYGFLDDSYNMITSETDPIITATYYFGTNEDGAMVTGWYQTSLNGDGYYGDNYWFYFNTSTGKKIVSTDKTISSVKYSFKDNGIMRTGWAQTEATGSDAEYWRRFSSSGALEKSKWVNAVPAEDMNAGTDYSDSTYRWFYVNGEGKVVHDTTKRINSKWYIFDTYGRMKTGLATVLYDGNSTATMSDVTYGASLSDYTGAQVMALESGTLISYFSADSTDGAAKTGTIKIELADDTYTFYFNKNYFAANGVVSKKVYVNGILQAAGSDIKYTVKENTRGNSGEYDYYLVNSTGTIFTSSTVVRDGDENYIALHKNDDGSITYIKIASGDYASAAANYFKTNGTLTGYTYESSVKVLVEPWDFKILD